MGQWSLRDFTIVPSVLFIPPGPPAAHDPQVGFWTRAVVVPVIESFSCQWVKVKGMVIDVTVEGVVERAVGKV